jgi:hypothetical protein
MWRMGTVAVLTLCAVCACSNNSSASGSPGSLDGGGIVQPPSSDAGAPGTDDAGTAAPGDDAGATAPGDDAGTAADAGAAPDAGTIGAADAGTDGGTAFADCDGIVPAALGTSVTAQVTSSSALACADATSDESGNVAAESHTPGARTFDWEIFTSQGQHEGSARAINGDLFPQGLGFEALKTIASAPNFVRIAPDGTLSHQHVVGNEPLAAHDFRAWPDGLVVFNAVCPQAPGAFEFFRFGDDGSVLARSTIPAPPPNGCALAGVANAPGGITLALFYTDPGRADNELVGQWFKADGTAMTGIFTLQTAAPVVPLTLRTLVTGDVAVQGSAGHWLGIIAANGGTVLTPPPSWLADGHDLTIVRNEKAYALIPQAGSLNHLDLVSIQGNVCGTVTFPGVQSLTTGADGTVIGSAGAQGCTKTWWPALLK